MSRRRDRDRQGARSLHVRGYEVQGTSDRELRSVFEAFGQVLDVYLPKDHYTKELRGFAYIQFSQESEAEEARRKLDRTDVFKDGNEIHIMWAAGERKTPLDMRRLDVVRDNPHARHARIAQGGDWPRSPPYGRGGNKRYRSPSPRYDRHRRDDRSPYGRRGGRRRSRSPYGRRDFRSPPRYGGRRSRSRSPYRRRGDRSPPPYRRHSPRRRDNREGRSPGREYSRSPPVPRRGESGDRRDRGGSRSPYRRGGSRSPAPKRRATSRSPRRRSNSPAGYRKMDPRMAPSGNTTSGIVPNATENGNGNGGVPMEGANLDPRTNGDAKLEDRKSEPIKMEPAGDNFPK